MKDGDIDNAISAILEMLSNRLDEKGRGIFISSHEILGIVAEEYAEFTKAVEDNDVAGQRSELIDIAVAAILGVVARSTGKMDW
jgi:hypothetical protein